jgi:hypothetical protein
MHREFVPVEGVMTILIPTHVTIPIKTKTCLCMYTHVYVMSAMLSSMCLGVSYVCMCIYIYVTADLIQSLFLRLCPKAMSKKVHLVHLQSIAHVLMRQTSGIHQQ